MRALPSWQRATWPPHLFNEKYRLKNPKEDGEFDVIIETSSHILFLECKAKAPTRVTMAGNPVEALFDYCGAILEGQLQALRHERILRERKEIDLESGRKLQLGDRQISRLCVTLLDHGALQDFSFISGITSAMLRLDIDPVAGYAKAAKVRELKALLSGLRSEFAKLEKLGLHPSKVRLSTRSLSVAQLALLIDGCQNAEAFIKRISSYAIFGTQNPLMEFLTAQAMSKSAGQKAYSR